MADLIERQAAIDAVRDRMGKGETNIGDTFIECFEMILNALPSAQPEPQWISCKDRLSEIAKRVLVTLINGNVIIAQHHTVKCGSEDTWVFEPTGLQFMYDKTTVDAWMPLPESYKGEDQWGY